MAMLSLRWAGPVCMGRLPVQAQLAWVCVTVLRVFFLLSKCTNMEIAGVSEKVWDAYTEHKSRFGYAWSLLTQDILQFDVDTDQALSRIATANRTCRRVVWCCGLILTLICIRVCMQYLAWNRRRTK